MPNELLQTLLILAIIAVVVGIAKLTKYIINRSALPPFRFPHVRGWQRPKELSPFKEKIKNTSTIFLEKVVNQRKAAIARLVASGFITWEEYYGLYEALMMWKENKLKDIEAGTYIYL
jgi:hypothetical protein